MIEGRLIPLNASNWGETTVVEYKMPLYGQFYHIEAVRQAVEATGMLWESIRSESESELREVSRIFAALSLARNMGNLAQFLL